MSLSTSASSLSEMPATTSASNSNESSPRSHDHKPPKYYYTSKELRFIGAAMDIHEIWEKLRTIDQIQPEPRQNRHNTYTIGNVFDFKSFVEEIDKQTPTAQTNTYNPMKPTQASMVSTQHGELSSSVADFFRKAQPYCYSPHLLPNIDSSKVVSVSKLEEELLRSTKEK